MPIGLLKRKLPEKQDNRKIIKQQAALPLARLTKPELVSRVCLTEKEAAMRFGRELSNLLLQVLPEREEMPVLLCIGTDRSTGDCLGPLVGSELRRRGLSSFRLYGTLENPVQANNLQQVMTEIKQSGSPLVIAVDACLGQAERIGEINLVNGPLSPGAGLNKRLPLVGDLHIVGIVNVGGYMENLVLQNTRLNLVIQMAAMISDGIVEAFTTIEKTRNKR